MNVIPVTAPGPASTGQMATNAESQQASAAASGRGNARQRQVASTVEQGISEAKANTNRSIQAETPDRQGLSPAESADRQKAEQLKAFIGDNSVRLSTYHDEESGRSILQVRDQVTGDVVSQYPSEELIRLYAALRHSFVDQSA